MTDLEYCVLDMTMPCIVKGTDAWFWNHGEWHWVCSGDAIHNAKMIGKENFDRMFGELPPLPE
jgi:hypothetical protein